MFQQGTAPAPLDQERLSAESLEDYKQHSQAQHQELVNNIYNLRRDLHDAEALRNRVHITAWCTEHCLGIAVGEDY